MLLLHLNCESPPETPLQNDSKLLPDTQTAQNTKFIHVFLEPPKKISKDTIVRRNA